MLSGEGVRRIVRSYFDSSGFTSELVLDVHCSDSEPSSKPGQPQARSLGQRLGVQGTDDRGARHGAARGRALLLLSRADFGATAVLAARPPLVGPGARTDGHCEAAPPNSNSPKVDADS